MRKKSLPLKAEEEAKKSVIIKDMSDLSCKLEDLDNVGTSQSKQNMYDFCYWQNSSLVS